MILKFPLTNSEMHFDEQSHHMSPEDRLRFNHALTMLAVEAACVNARAQEVVKAQQALNEANRRFHEHVTAHQDLYYKYSPECRECGTPKTEAARGFPGVIDTDQYGLIECPVCTGKPIDECERR